MKIFQTLFYYLSFFQLHKQWGEKSPGSRGKWVQNVMKVMTQTSGLDQFESLRYLLKHSSTGKILELSIREEEQSMTVFSSLN
jgi:hypothetical protein